MPAAISMRTAIGRKNKEKTHDDDEEDGRERGKKTHYDEEDGRRFNDELTEEEDHEENEIYIYI